MATPRMAPHGLILSISLVAARCWAASLPVDVSLPGNRVFPESITATRDGTVYIGSVGQGGIIRLAVGAISANVWIPPGTFGSASTFGVLADEKQHTLWVCSNDMTAIGVTIRGADKGSYLKGFDLATGAGKISVRLPGSPTLWNDMTVGSDGSVYVTNTFAPQILRLPPNGQHLEVWFDDAVLQPADGAAGLDGIAFGEDGNLYITRYAPGDLFRVRVSGGRAAGVTPLRLSRKLVLPDGLRRVGPREFLLVEGEGRLDSIAVHGEDVEIRVLRDGLRVPTGVAPVGRQAWVSEGQLSLLFDPAKRNELPSLPFKIFSVAF